MNKVFTAIVTFCLALNALTIIQGPQVGNNTDSSITFGWFTDSASGSRVEYGLTANGLSGSVSDTNRVQWHVIKAGNLAPGTRYFYRVSNGATQSRVFSSKTLPGKGRTFRFGAFGDSHGGGDFKDNYGGYGSSPDLMRDSLDLLFNIGDVVAPNDVPETTAFRLAIDYKKRTDSVEHYVPIYELFGNHDATEGFRKVWADPDTSIYSFVLPKSPPLPSNYPQGLVYSFDVGTVHFIAIGSYFSGLTRWVWLPPDILAWVLGDIDSARARGAQQLLLLKHEGLIDFINSPAWNFNIWRNAWYNPDIEKIYAALDTHGVELILHAHDHCYWRVNLGPRIDTNYVKIWDEKGSITEIETGLIGTSRYGADGGWDLPVYSLVPGADAYTRFDVDFRQIRGNAVYLTNPNSSIIDSFTLRPDAPQNLIAGLSGGKAALSWQKVEDRISLHGVKGYYVYRSAVSYDSLRNTPMSRYMRIGRTDHPDSVRFIDEAPLPGGGFYVVSAYDTNYWQREGNYSNEAAATSEGLRMPPVTDRTAVICAGPNPFFSECGISVRRDMGRGKLRIFGVSGKKVLELDLRAPFTFRWKAQGLASGLYIADWKTEGSTLRESLFLLK